MERLYTMDINGSNINLIEVYKKLPLITKVALWMFFISFFLNQSYDLGYKLGNIIKGIF